MIRAMFSRVKPRAAAAQPEYELSIDTTTGMSAPPIGMIRVTPSTRARAKISRKAQLAWPSVAISTPINTTTARPRTMLSTCRAGRMIGAPDMLPFSLAKAMTEPVKVMAPMAQPSDSSISDCVLMPPAPSSMPKAMGENRAPSATMQAAMPTSEWKAATSCGIWVMATFCAISVPMMPPTAMPHRISTIVVRSSVPLEARLSTVTPTAMAMPIMP